MLFIIYKTNVSNIVILIIIKLDLKKRIDLKDILGITVNNISDEFILHFKLLETDYRYSSPKKNEIISTIAEAYYKYTNSKLLFSNVQEEPLKDYVTYESYKDYNENYTLMKKKNTCFIENILNFNKKKKIEESIDDDEDDKLKNKNNENEKTMGDGIMKLDEKNNYDLHTFSNQNPFSNALKYGAITYGVGVSASFGSIAACLIFDSVYLISASGELLTAGFAFMSGQMVTGIGLIVAIPSLLGFGIYKLYSWNKDKKRQEFFKDFGEAKMKTEREVYLNIINKIDNYFSKFISNDDKETKCRITNIENYISSILDIYIKIENNRFNSSLELIKKEKRQDKIEKLIISMNYGVSITIKNMAKIRTELMKVVTSSTNTDIKLIFNEGIPYFKEFIKNFGPIKINEKKQKKIDEIILELIQDIKWILENKMQVGFNKFDSKLFLNSFESYLIQKHEEKKRYDLDMEQSNFISNCKDYLITPIANKSNNFGVLSLFFKFTTIIQEIAIKKKDLNYNEKKAKLDHLNQEPTNDDVRKSSIIPGDSRKNEESKEVEIERSETVPNMKDNKEIPFKNENENINVIFIIEKNIKIYIQAKSGMCVNSLIKNFIHKTGYDNNYIKKYLIEDKILLDPSTNETLQDKGMTDGTIIMAYKE